MKILILSIGVLSFFCIILLSFYGHYIEKNEQYSINSARNIILAMCVLSLLVIYCLLPSIVFLMLSESKINSVFSEKHKIIFGIYWFIVSLGLCIMYKTIFYDKSESIVISIDQQVKKYRENKNDTQN